MSRTPRPRASAFVLLALLLTLTALAAREEDPRFVPDPSVPESPPLHGATWVAEASAHVVRIQRIDEVERRTYLRSVTGSTLDPFATHGDERPRFQTFLVQIENTGDAELTFQSRSCWLVGERAEVLTPFGLDELRTEYSVLGEEFPQAYDRSAPALLEGSQRIVRGESVAGLLIFRSVQPKTRRFRLEVPLTNADGDVLQVSVPYRRMKRRELESGGDR